MGSPYFATTATHHPSPPPSKAATRIYLGSGPRAYTRTTNAWRDYPPASPHRLPTTGSGPTLPPPPTPKGGKTGFGGSASPAPTRTHHHRHGNINPSPPHYPRPPRPRSRPPPGGTTRPTNPSSSARPASPPAFSTPA